MQLVTATPWHAAVIVKKEPNMPLAILQMVLSVLCAITLTGFSIFPRWGLYKLNPVDP
jgi:hypothetical protein